MPLYLVSCDLAKPKEDRQKALLNHEALLSYLNGLGSLKVLNSEFAVPFKKGAVELTMELKPFLKNGDHLLVSELFSGGSPVAVGFTALLVNKKTFFDLLNNHARSLL